jgi:uncharacterized protein YoxC
LILLIVGCALIVLCVGLWLYQRKMARLDHPSGTDDLDRLRQTKGLEKDLAQLTREIEQLTQRFTAELDIRTQKLEQLLAQADQRIEALQHLVGGPVRIAIEAVNAQPSAAVGCVSDLCIEFAGDTGLGGEERDELYAVGVRENVNCAPA